MPETVVLVCFLEYNILTCILYYNYNCWCLKYECRFILYLTKLSVSAYCDNSFLRKVLKYFQVFVGVSLICRSPFVILGLSIMSGPACLFSRLNKHNLLSLSSYRSLSRLLINYVIWTCWLALWISPVMHHFGLLDLVSPSFSLNDYILKVRWYWITVFELLFCCDAMVKECSLLAKLKVGKYGRLGKAMFGTCCYQGKLSNPCMH